MITGEIESQEMREYHIAPHKKRDEEKRMYYLDLHHSLVLIY